MSRQRYLMECCGKAVFTSPQAVFRVVCHHTPDGPLGMYRCKSGHWHYGGTKKLPDARHSAKQWKNWHWRKAVADTEGYAP